MPKVIVISAKKDGFRRCGVAHSAAETEWPGDYFSGEDLEILKAEPMLVVAEKDAPVKKDTPKDRPPKG
tara:strand:- start:454 stop:660 length:207 start_codon:yes stop_codon:yes gene_type:complete